MYFFRIKKVKRVPHRKTDNLWKKHIPTARLLVEEILLKIQESHNFEFNRVTIKNQSTRWGSCSSKKNLSFNYRIVFLPYELAEYLVVHELCHLREMNHSERFWDHVESILPNYKMLRKKLKDVRLDG